MVIIKSQYFKGKKKKQKKTRIDKYYEVLCSNVPEVDASLEI